MSEDIRDEEFAVLDKLARAVWQTAEEKGWHTDEAYRDTVLAAVDCAREAEVPLPKPIQDLILASEKRTRLANGVNIGEQLMLIVTENAEAMEAYRNAGLDPQKCYYEYDGELIEWDERADAMNAKPEGFGSEGADNFIRQLHLFMRVGVNIVAEMQRKMRYNQSRAFRHGGKRA